MQVLMSKLSSLSISPQKSLDNMVKCWLIIALVGQWFFAAYIIAVYALPTILGNSELTNAISPTRGIDSKARIDILMFFTHILPAALMAMSGLLQLVPKIRQKYPKFHRYNGRMFFVLAISGAVTGLYLTWGAGFRLSDIGSLGVTLNGLLIPIAIFFAWRFAMKKQIALHQRFAVHSFILVNGVWSFRLYLMAWYIINQGSNGNTKTLDGPADITLSFACYLLPMLIAELIFWAKRNNNEAIKWQGVVVASIGALITLVGVIAASMMMWYPRINQAFVGLF